MILIQWTVLIALGWVAHALLRSRHPLWRLIIWRSILCVGLFLPWFRLIPAPRLQIPVATPTRHQVEAVVSNHSTGTARTAPADRSAARPADLSVSSAAVPWVDWLILGWAVGFAWEALSLCRLQARIWRLRRESRLPDANLQKLADEIGVRLDLESIPAVRLSDRVASPFICGVLKPMIILPSALAQSVSEDEMTALLTHETAHLSRHDLAWCAGWRWMGALLWFHPLVWRIPSAHNLACEEEADRIASDKIEGEGLYTRLLAKLSLRILAPPGFEYRLTLNAMSQITRRLTRLAMGKTGSWNGIHSFAGFCLVVGLLTSAVGWQVSQASETQTSGALRVSDPPAVLAAASPSAPTLPSPTRDQAPAPEKSHLRLRPISKPARSEAKATVKAPPNPVVAAVASPKALPPKIVETSSGVRRQPKKANLLVARAEIPRQAAVLAPAARSDEAVQGATIRGSRTGTALFDLYYTVDLLSVDGRPIADSEKSWKQDVPLAPGKRIIKVQYSHGYNGAKSIAMFEARPGGRYEIRFKPSSTSVAFWIVDLESGNTVTDAAWGRPIWGPIAKKTRSITQTIP